MMERKSKIRSFWQGMLCLLVLFIAICTLPEMCLAAEEDTVDYSMDRPLLMRGKSLEKAASFANVTDLSSLKSALNGSASEIYINKEIKITENLDIPAGKFLLRGYNQCYGTMFVIPSGVTVTVRSEIDASGDQTRLYTGPVFDVQSGGKLQILSGSIYGSVSDNNGGAIVNNGTVEIKGGTLQGHTTTKQGGAIYNNGKLTVTGGQIEDNRAMADASVNAGGAIYNTASGTMVYGGGVSRTNYSLGNGGSIYNEGSLTIEQGRFLLNKAQKKGNGIYSTKDVAYTGKNYVNSDEVVSEKGLLVQGAGFSNASEMTGVSFDTNKTAENQSAGKITCTSLSGELVNHGHVYYKGEGKFTQKLTGDGWFHTSKKLEMDSPAFACGITVDKGELTMTNAAMADHEVIVSSGTLKGSGSGTVKVKGIGMRGGTYLIENVPFGTAKDPLDGGKYLDTEKIHCSTGGRLTVKSKDAPVLDGKSAFYVPIGKQVSINQTDVNFALLQNNAGALVSESGKYGRSRIQESGVTYIQVQPAEAYQLKVLFKDKDNKQQMFPKTGISINLRNDYGYTVNAEPVSNAEGFNVPGNANYGAYVVDKFPAGWVNVYASFTDKSYRGLSGRVDLQKDDIIILRPQIVVANPSGTWWTDEGNYDIDKYNELKNAVSGNRIQINDASELAAVAKVVSWPKSGDAARDLSGITIELKKDIDLNNFQWKPIGYDTNKFNGTFEGGNYVITNMSIGFPEADQSLKYIGLFGYCSNGSVISNVRLKDYTFRLKPVAERSQIGGLAGVFEGKMTNCAVVGGTIECLTTEKVNIGGMVGNVQTGNTTITKCSVSEVELNSKTGNTNLVENYVGGFVGIISGTVTASKAEQVEIHGSNYSGGFAGYNQNGGTIKNCFVKGNMTGENYIGGFVCSNEGNIEYSYTEVNIDGEVVGGFAREIGYGKVLNCYSKGTMTGARVAGFADNIYGSVVESCYASGNLVKKHPASQLVGFASNNYLIGSNMVVRNSYFTGRLDNDTGMAVGFVQDNFKNGSTLESNYSLAKISKNNSAVGGFGGSLETGSINILNDNFYYSNINKASANNVNKGISRILEPNQIMAGKHTAVTYTLHKELPTGAVVKSLKFDDNISGATIRQVNDTTYEVTPLIDFGVLHLSGEMVVENAKLNVPTGDVPEGWDFEVAAEDTVMPVTEDILLCKVDFEKEEILAPNITGLQKNGKNGTVDTEDDSILKFPVQDGDFANLIPFASPELQSNIFIPERPKVPVVNCLISADKQILMFTTNDKHETYQEENAVRPNTKYEYSLDGGKTYQPVTSTSDGKVVVSLTKATLSGFMDISDADAIKDARLRLAATEDSFRSKAMAEEVGNEIVPPEPSEDVFQVTYYLNDGTNKIYQADMAVDGKVSKPTDPKRKGFLFKGWYKERGAQDTAPYDFAQTLTENIKLYAHWEAVSYTIRTETDAPEKSTHVVYEASQNPAEAKAEGIFTEGAAIVLEAEATDSHYTFLYWKEGDTIVSERAKVELDVTKNVTFTACFKNEKPKAPTPDAPVYHWITQKEIGVNVVQGQEYAIRKEGETAYGPWQASGEFKGLETNVTYQIVTRIIETDNFAVSDISQPLTVTTLKPESYAIRTQTDAPNKSTHVVYDVLQGVAGAATEGIFQEGTTVVLEAASTDSLCTFLYWKEGDTIVSESPRFEVKVGKDQTFTACFQSEKPKAPTPAAPTYYWLTQKEIGINEIQGQEYAIRKEGGTEYSPWQTSGRFDSLESSATYQIVTRIPENSTLAASDMSQPLIVMTLKEEIVNQERSRVYTVTFLDGTTVVSSQTVQVGAAAIAPEVNKTGYQLSWSIPYSNVTSDLIVRAVWKPNVYTITLKPNGGKMAGNNKQTAVYDRKYEELPKVSRSGYTFKGWYNKKSGGSKITKSSVVKILKNTTYYAQWTKISLKKPNLKSLKNEKGLKVKATWTSVSNTDGYRLEYSTDKKFKKSETKTVKVSKPKSGNPTKTLSKLKKGKTYYIRITAYKKDSAGKTIYGSKSNVRNVVIKK